MMPRSSHDWNNKLHVLLAKELGVYNWQGWLSKKDLGIDRVIRKQY